MAIEPEVSHLADALIKTVYCLDSKEVAVVHARNIIAHLASVGYEIAPTDRDF